MNDQNARLGALFVARERAGSDDRVRHVRVLIVRALIYGALVLWAFVCLFPIFWTVTTSFKTAVDVTQGHLIPWLDFQPDWRGWRSLGLSPDMFERTSTVRDEFMLRFTNSIIVSV